VSCNAHRCSKLSLLLLRLLLLLLLLLLEPWSTHNRLLLQRC
jgi:hypothetical protein